MLRSAAKNYHSVTVVVDPADYARRARGDEGERRRHDARTARAAGHQGLRTTSKYDAAIASYLNKEQECADRLSASANRWYSELRYGDNPHQTAALYGTLGRIFREAARQGTLLHQHPRHHRGGGTDRGVRRPTVAILKHTNPCGVGSDARPARGVGQGVRDGQAGAVRRHHRLQSPAHRALATRDQRDFHRRHHRAGLRGRCARPPAEEEKPAPHAQARLPVQTKDDHADPRASSVACWCRAATRRLGLEHRVEGRDRAPADDGGTGGHALRVESGEAREEQRHRLSPRTTARSASARGRCPAWIRAASRSGRRRRPA